jgi:hypothetical protein
LNVERSDVEGPHFPGDASAADDRDNRAIVEPDPARVKQRGRDTRTSTANASPTDRPQRGVARAGPAAQREVKNAAAFQKELALLGKEQIKAGEIDLLFVHLNLGKVGVVRQIRGQISRNAVLDVHTDVAIQVVLLR